MLTKRELRQLKEGNARLLRLAAFLRELPAKRFDYNFFVGDGWKGAQDLSCGTTACAIGWAATMPEFRRRGLRLIGTSAAVDYQGQEGGSGCADGTVEDRHTFMSGVQAGNRIFYLTEDEGHYLFYPRDNEWKASAKHVAAKIEEFVRRRSEEKNNLDFSELR